MVSRESVKNVENCGGYGEVLCSVFFKGLVVLIVGELLVESIYLLVFLGSVLVEEKYFI